jgi:Ca2+-binding RTX toxin-like protein
MTGGVGAVTLGAAALTVAIASSEPLTDTLTVNTLAGADAVNATGLAATSLLLFTVDGGTEDDIVVGSAGADTLNGDAGFDILSAGNGNDTLNGGADTDYCDGGAGIDVGSLCETSVNIP